MGITEPSGVDILSIAVAGMMCEKYVFFSQKERWKISLSYNIRPENVFTQSFTEFLNSWLMKIKEYLPMIASLSWITLMDGTKSLFLRSLNCFQEK